MEQSILTSIKAPLGLAETYAPFDFEIIMHINSALATLNQLGVGPAAGFSIDDKTPVWSDFIGDDKSLNNVKSYIFMKVKVLFDPPATPPLLAAYEKMITEQEWRLRTTADPMIPQMAPLELPLLVVIDGGEP